MGGKIAHGSEGFTRSKGDVLGRVKAKADGGGVQAKVTAKCRKMGMPTLAR